MNAKHFTARNSAFLKEAKREWNKHVFAHVADLFNSFGGAEAAITYMQGFIRSDLPEARAAQAARYRALLAD
jgi:hypothetical protein